MNKYKRAAETMRRIANKTHCNIHPDVALIQTLLDLAAQLPDGEAERVLRQAVEKRKPRKYPCPSNMCDMEECRACDGDGWVRP